MSQKYKRFVVATKLDYIIYLRHLIIMSSKFINRYDLYVNQLEVKIKELGLNIDPKLTIDAEEYEVFNDKIQRNSNKILNIFGDLQPDSLSYYKFRKSLVKRNHEVKEILGDLSKELWSYLSDMNIARNWGLHEPESLLNAHLENIKEQWKKDDIEIYKTTFNPINIPNFIAYEGKWLLDLLDSSKNSQKIHKELYNSMISDFQKLTGCEVNINYVDVHLRPFDSEILLPKTSFAMQSKKYKSKE